MGQEASRCQLTPVEVLFCANTCMQRESFPLDALSLCHLREQKLYEVCIPSLAPSLSQPSSEAAALIRAVTISLLTPGSQCCAKELSASSGIPMGRQERFRTQVHEIGKYSVSVTHGVSPLSHTPQHIQPKKQRCCSATFPFSQHPLPCQLCPLPRLSAHIKGLALLSFSQPNHSIPPSEYLPSYSLL